MCPRLERSPSLAFSLGTASSRFSTENRGLRRSIPHARKAVCVLRVPTHFIRVPPRACLPSGRESASTLVPPSRNSVWPPPRPDFLLKIEDSGVQFLTHAKQFACCVFQLISFVCPREESNLDFRFRKPMSYPLNDGGILNFHLNISISYYIFNVILSF